MIDVVPYGPSKRYTINYSSVSGIRPVYSYNWYGKLYVLSPKRAGKGYSFNIDTIETIDGKMSPRYHDCEHSKFSGVLDVGLPDENYTYDIPTTVVTDVKSYRYQPLVATAWNGSISAQGFTEGPYRYSGGKDDKGSYVRIYECEQGHLFPEWGEDPDLPEAVTITFTGKRTIRYFPDEGCKAHEDQIDRATTSYRLPRLSHNVAVACDKTFPESMISHDQAWGVIKYVKRRYARDRAFLADELDAKLPYSRLIYKAAENIRLLDINMISFIKEQSELFKGGYLRTFFHRNEAQEFDALLKNRNVKTLKKLRKTVKFAASEYLGMHYGTKLTALDFSDIMESHLKMQEMLEATQTMGAVLSHGFFLPSGTDCSVTRRFKGEIQSLTDQDLTIVEASDKFVRELFEIDILPSASNIWDLIPYSFVVDWFVPLGNKLEDIEKGHYIETLHPRKTFYSTKARISMPILQFIETAGQYFKVAGTVEATWYERLCDDCFYEGSPCVEDSSGMTVTHGIEAGALLISRFF